MNKIVKNNALWVFYSMFVVIAMVTHKGEPIFSIAGPYGFGKAVVWLLLLAFLLYSLYCNWNENFFKTMHKITPYLWFRQVSLDLYIGLLIPLFLIYLHTGSWLVVALWFVPILLMANLASLLYLALNYQSLVGYFV